MKQNKIGIIKLGDGYGLIIPPKTDTIKIMVAIGQLIQIWAFAEMDQGGIDPDKLKNMANDFIDVVLQKIFENCTRGD